MAYCAHCGTPVSEGQGFCAVCGTATSIALAPTPPASVSLGASFVAPSQARWSVLFRPLLVLPLALAVGALEVASLGVVVAAWCCAVVTGRVPDPLQRFLTGVLRAGSNVLFYTWFLVARWPGVVFAPRPAAPVSLEVDHVGLRRAAVLFRLVLGYPAALVGGVLGFGALPLWFVMWVWGIVAGRQPRALHQAAALVARYQVRLLAYHCLVTPTQPFRGLFGDERAPSEPVAVAPGASSTRWPAARSARVVVTLVLLLGAPSFVLANTADTHWAQDLFVRPLVASSHATVVRDVRAFVKESRTCPAAGRRACVARAASAADVAVRQQATLLDETALFPAVSRAAATRYQRALGQLDGVMRAIEFDASLGAQRREIDRDLPPARRRVERDYERLWSRLGE